MKVYNLCCAADHRFEGWFPSAQDLDDQAQAGLVECPYCGTVDVVRAPTAPHVKVGAPLLRDPQPGREPESRPAGVVADGQSLAAGMPSADHLRAMFLTMARELAARSEDVGDRFVEEARRIFYQEAPERAIRGIATPADAQELIEEGIAVLPLPPASLPKKNDLH